MGRVRLESRLRLMRRAAFQSCGTPVSTGCPAGDQCWAYRPTFTSDDEHRVDGAIFDSGANKLDQLGLQIKH